MNSRILHLTAYHNPSPISSKTLEYSQHQNKHFINKTHKFNLLGILYLTKTYQKSSSYISNPFQNSLPSSLLISFAFFLFPSVSDSKQKFLPRIHFNHMPPTHLPPYTCPSIILSPIFFFFFTLKQKDNYALNSISFILPVQWTGLAQLQEQYQWVEMRRKKKP